MKQYFTMHNVRIGMQDGTAINATIYALYGESAERSIQRRYPQYQNAMHINTLGSERLSTDMFAFPDILKGA